MHHSAYDGQPVTCSLETFPFLELANVQRAFNSGAAMLLDNLGRVEALKASLVRHKPGKRCMVRFELHASRVGALSVLGKVRFKGLDRRVVAIGEQLYATGFDAEQTIFTPRPLGVIPEWNMTLQEYVDGEALEPSQPEFIERQSLIAKGISKLHFAPLRLDRKFGPHDELQLLVRLLEQTVTSQPRFATGIGQVLGRARERVDNLPQNASCPIHRDFYFDQLLFFPEERLALVDLDMVCQGPAGLDVGNYVAHLIEYGLRYPAVAQPCNQAANRFLHEYSQLPGWLTASELDTWVYLSLARHIYLSQSLPGRAHTTEALLEWLLSRR